MTNSNLDPKPDPRDSPDSPEDNEPDSVATPEGDDEGPPDAPSETHLGWHADAPLPSIPTTLSAVRASSLATS